MSRSLDYKTLTALLGGNTREEKMQNIHTYIQAGIA